MQLRENCTKHEALLKATTLLRGSSTLPSSSSAEPQPAAKLFVASGPLERIAVVTKLFKYFANALPKTKKGVEYLESRGINYKLHEVGYNSGDWHYKLNEPHFIKSSEQVGLLKERPAKGFTAWAKDCIVFPLKNAENKIISLYGRSIANNDESKHFYLSNRSGLYPGYPSLQTKKLILAESIIDAASLLQQETIKNDYTVLSLYGTNGLTEEHSQAIIALPQLEEIVLMLDADEAGEAATAKHYNTLKTLLPGIHITRTNLPAGEDVNSLLQSHDDPKILSDIIEQRKGFFLSSETEPSAIPIPPALQSNSNLNTSNAELLIYDNCQLRIEVLGGIKITGLDRMKVTLKVLYKEKKHLLPVGTALIYTTASKQNN